MYHPSHQEPRQMLAYAELRVTRPRKAIADILFKGDHHHFHVESDGRVIDIAPDQIAFARVPEPPAGHRIVNIDVVIRLERSEEHIDHSDIAEGACGIDADCSVCVCR